MRCLLLEGWCCMLIRRIIYRKMAVYDPSPVDYPDKLPDMIPNQVDIWKNVRIC
jgi:hypothetical protein